MLANFHQCRLLAVNVCRRTKTIVILNYVQSLSYYFARLETDAATDAATKNVAKSNDFSSPLKNQQQTLSVYWWSGTLMSRRMNSFRGGNNKTKWKITHSHSRQQLSTVENVKNSNC